MSEARTRRMGFRTRLVVVVAAAVGLSVALASAASYIAVRRQMVAQVDTQLRRQADLVKRRVRPEIPNLAGSTGPLQRSGLNSFVAFQVIGANGNIVIRDTTTPLPVTSVDRTVAAGKRDAAFRSIGSSADGNHTRVLTVSVGGGLAVQLARPLADIDRTLAHLALVLLLVAAAGVVVALLLGYLVGKTSLRPVERLTEAVERVGTTRQLDERIEVAGNDELSRLATSFNSMLGALDESRRQQAQLVADAGHELRTPLTSLRTNIEVLIKIRDLPDGDRQALLADVTAQLGELTTLVGDLVELARDDEQRPESEELRLDVVVEEAVERARRRAPSLAFRVALSPAVVRSQPALLERAILNVLDNAAKWSPPGSAVEVSLAREDRSAAGSQSWLLEVRDHGPGITEEDQPHVFDRFYRSVGARSFPGSGLGLAIVRQVVESSGGSVQATVAPAGGALIRIRLPGVEPAVVSVPRDPDPEPMSGTSLPLRPIDPGGAGVASPPDAQLPSRG